jgi:hypothetical protein
LESIPATIPEKADLMDCGMTRPPRRVAPMSNVKVEQNNSASRCLRANADAGQGIPAGIESRVAGQGTDRLLRIAALAAQLDTPPTAADARSAAGRIAEGRFYVACLGQFKRGKSTLLNALMGEPILPSGVLPVTSVPTVLRFAPTRSARVRFHSSAWIDISFDEIEQFVSEPLNPENAKGVAGIEISVPSPLLAEGMCLVDTPGLGSVFSGNSAATRSFLPHVDAAIVVIGADPPIGADELALVEDVARRVPNIFFVLNKADRATAEERLAAISFANRILEAHLHRTIPMIYEISARERLESGQLSRDWDAFVSALQSLSRERAHIVCDAANRAIERCCQQLRLVIHEQRQALIRPFESSERRIAELRESISAAGQSLSDLAPLFSGEQQRWSRTFVDHRSAFLKDQRVPAHRHLTVRVQSQPKAFGPKYRRTLMQTAQEIAREHVVPWLECESRHAEQAYRGVARRFVEMANGFLARVRSQGAAEFALLPEDLSPRLDLELPWEFRFYEFTHRAKPASPARYFADILLGILGLHSSIDAAAHEFLDLLLETNSERVRNNLEERIAESRLRLEAEIIHLLQELGSAAEQALIRARSVHAAGAAAVESSLRRLAEVEAELARCGASPTLGVPL